MFACQLLVLVLFTLSFFKGMYTAVEGRKAEDGAGGVGAMIWIIIFALMLALEYGAGMFDKFWFLAQ